MSTLSESSPEKGNETRASSPWSGGRETLRTTGRFSCSNHLVNMLFAEILRSQQRCFAREETISQEELMLLADTAGWNLDMAGFFRRRLTEEKVAGSYAGIILLRQLFRKYGDLESVGKYLPAASSFLDEAAGMPDMFSPETFPVLGDPCNAEDPTPGRLAGMALLAGMNRICAQLGADAGERAVARRRQAAYEAAKRAFMKEFYTGELRFKGSSQTAKVLALSFDLVPEDRDLWALLVESLLDDIEKKRKMHCSTGVLGSALLLPALVRAEALDTAYRLLLQSSPPSWLAPVIRGEEFPCLRGAVGRWFYEGICGIQPDPGFRRFRIAPRFGRFLDHAEAEYDSVYGKIVSKWRREGEDYLLDFTVPPDTEAFVRGRLFTPGTYSLKIKHY